MKATQSTARLDHLRSIEVSLQKKWMENRVFESNHVPEWSKHMSKEEKDKGKYFCTFPYAYMNGQLHLGHLFSLSKAEFASRYQRLQGKNVLFPIGFHCTGMPISAAAIKVGRELKNPDLEQKQIGILKSLKVSDEDIPKFVDPNFWVDYFPPIGRTDLQNVGVGADFRRSFVTTEANPHYDKFIQWQFTKLKQADVLKFGKRNSIFCLEDDQPCADHDRSVGEGVGISDYTLIKMRITHNCPEQLKELNEKTGVFMLAGTFRPETMYGQTNCYVLPNANYNVYELANGEYGITSEHAAKNMVCQGILKEEFKEPSFVARIMGSDLIGVGLSAPLSVHETIYVIPMLTISMTKATGVVTSVPSDSPDDYVTLSEVRANKEMREKYNITDEMLAPELIEIISIPEYGNAIAKTLVDKAKINKKNRTEVLAELKDIAYNKGFYEGVMSIGEFKGMPVKEAKEKIKEMLIEKGLALGYSEPESKVVSRSGHICVVAPQDQWYIAYGQGKHQELLKKYVESQFVTYSAATKNLFLETIDWLKEWGCSRSFGLGTKIPWDTQYVIESLSDSTIYMSYYTIAHFLHKDIYGKEALVQAEDLTEEVFDFVFLGKDLDFSKTKIPEEKLREMRDSFTYWYPMDLRVSAKDLIKNHLTMSLYNHSFVWNEEYMLPKSYFCNGYINVNNEKMSKSSGTFITVGDCKESGVDVTRITIAESGDTLTDANFLTDIQSKNVHRLTAVENFLKILIKEYWNKNEVKFVAEPVLENNFDKVFSNNLNYLLINGKKNYEEMKFREVTRLLFYAMLNNKDEYVLYNEEDFNKLNPSLMLKFFRVFLIAFNPIAPHWTEHMYHTYLNPIFKANGLDQFVVEECLAFARFPEVTDKIDNTLFKYNKVVKQLITDINDTKNKVKGADKGFKVKVFYKDNYTPEQETVFGLIKDNYDADSNKVDAAYKEKIRSSQTDKKKAAGLLQFGSYIAREVESFGSDVLSTVVSTSDSKVVEENIEFLKKMTGCAEVQSVEFDEKTKIKSLKRYILPGSPFVVCEKI